MEDNEDESSFAIEALRRQKAQLEEENSGLVSRLKDGQKFKSELKEERKSSQKLVHRRDKLKNLVDTKSSGNSLESSTSQFPQSLERNKGEDHREYEQPGDSEVLERRAGKDKSNVSLVREVKALKAENSALVQKTRKVEEQKKVLEKEITALKTRNEKLESVCTSLEKETVRLSSCVSNSQYQQPSNEEDIELLKEQLCLYQEQLEALENQNHSSQRSNERLKAELNEARLVIRNLRKPPRLQVYPAAAVYQPIYRAYDENGFMPFDREPLAYNMVRSNSGDDILSRNVYRGPRRQPVKKSYDLTPDLTAVVDNGIEVEDHSLSSAKSI